MRADDLEWHQCVRDRKPGNFSLSKKKNNNNNKKPHTHTHTHTRAFKYLNAVVAGGDAAVLNFHIGSRVRKFAIRVGSGALVPLVFPAHLQLQPSGIFSVQQIVHVYYGHVFAVFISRNEKKSRLYPFAGRLYRICYERFDGRLFWLTWRRLWRPVTYLYCR